MNVVIVVFSNATTVRHLVPSVCWSVDIIYWCVELLSVDDIFENLQEQVDTGAFLELKASNYESLEPDMHFDVIINATSLSKLISASSKP